MMTERRLPIKTREIKLTGEWEGWNFTARMNPPLDTFFDITSGDLARLVSGIASILIAWNFVDTEGNALLAPTLELVKQHVTTELLNALANGYIDAMAQIPPV
jgi:hypothetical protein